MTIKTKTRYASLAIVALLLIASTYQTQVTYELRKCADGEIPVWSEAQGKWGCGQQASAASIPSGTVIIITSGACPQGYSEATELNGVTIVGTVAANGDVGSSGGSNTVTPSGSISQSLLSMSPYTPQGSNSGGAVSAHSGTAVADHASHTHPFAASSNAATPDLMTVNTAAAGVAASGTTGGPSVTLTHTVTQPSNHTFTNPVFNGTQAILTGSVSVPNFTGNSFDNRGSFIRCIFCRKD